MRSTSSRRWVLEEGAEVGAHVHGVAEAHVVVPRQVARRLDAEAERDDAEVEDARRDLASSAAP
jgi:hypothetical protein